MEPQSTRNASALLRGAELLAELIDEDLSYFASRCGRKALDAGELLFSAGSRAERFFIVEVGEVVVIREGAEIARFGPGDVVGDFDFARAALRDAEARALVPSQLLVFPTEGLSLSDLVRERPDSSARLLLRSIAMISSRLRSVQRLISENDPWVRELRRQSWTDGPTGLYTRSFLLEEAPNRFEAPTLFLLVKPDRFKELCDAHGHAAGDAAMVAIAGLLHDLVKGLGRGWAVRIKSNETALVVPGCRQEDAVELARGLAQGFARLDISSATGGDRFAFTASQALAFWPGDGQDPKRLFDAVYGVLTRAWRDGGERVYRIRSQAGAPPKGGTERRRPAGNPAGRQEGVTAGARASEEAR